MQIINANINNVMVFLEWVVSKTFFGSFETYKTAVWILALHCLFGFLAQICCPYKSFIAPKVFPKGHCFLWSKVWFFDPLPSSPIKHSCLDSYTRMYISGNLPFYLSTKFAKSRTFPLKISLVWFSIRKWSLSFLAILPNLLGEAQVFPENKTWKFGEDDILGCGVDIKYLIGICRINWQMDILTDHCSSYALPT